MLTANRPSAPCSGRACPPSISFACAVAVGLLPLSVAAGDVRRFLKEVDALIAFAPKALAEPIRSRALAQYRKARAYFSAQTDE